MIKAKAKPQPQIVPDSTSGTLAERLKQAVAEAEAFIDAKTAELKASPDGALLPIGVLRQMVTRHRPLCVQGRAKYSGEQMTEEDKKKQAAVLAEIKRLPEDATIEDYVRLLTSGIVIPETNMVH